MNFNTIGEIYSTNDIAREKLKGVVSNLSDEQLNFLPSDGSWSITHVVEHVSVVERSLLTICTKLLLKAEAEGRKADGSAKVSPSFLGKLAEAKETKLNAPEIVLPTCKQDVKESVGVMDETRKKVNELREKFETVEGTEFTFPHPAFGDMTAQDWLLLIGLHDLRHLKQIDRILKAQNEPQD